MSATTKEGITVRVGQVWRDRDSRMNGGARLCTVIEVVSDGKNTKALMSVNGTFGRTTRVRVDRMHKTSTGWTLESEGA